MSRYIPKKTRLFVKQRASYCCEYCKMPETFSFIGYEIDHIISRKHGGSNKLENLAYTCAVCNYRKGTDLGTMLLPSDKIVRFYNPRLDVWNDHFELSGYILLPKSEIGEATIKIFQFNEVKRVEERELLILAGLFPPK